ncbi:sugar phosphate isomerase/epimerase [Shimia sp. R10_1]|uniref:sugar phosphate isomerase/epimerase family protein n=1 Tax=Shimia sp. R10_1 TaxID=2821095 RepID=UPI001ADD5BA4|nr:sugar phosphate isomerase/epimerase [Shimia sp. R10_1]MBO9475222.1 sugar phosphate isomerase/epimerase [Shimia sp. R10_1]
MRVSAQLYTVRDVGTLQHQLTTARGCGYRDIETIGFHDLSPHRLAAQVRQSGLTLRSAHFDWADFEERLDDIVSLTVLLDCKTVVMPWLAPEQRPTTAEGWQLLADQMAIWADRLAALDIRFAYHNHDFDLQGDFGSTPLDQILSHSGVYWQPDIGWLAVAVADPLAWITRYADKIVSVHAKDVDPQGGVGDARWRDIGQGVVDWPSVLNALSNTPCRDLFVEHDAPSEPARSLATGRRVLSHLLAESVV